MRWTESARSARSFIRKLSEPAKFNTNRVAERAGISIGSLYQYYPNKAALLFQLHKQESSGTFDAIRTVLLDADKSPSRRLSDAVMAFFETEAAEAPLREGLGLARLYFRDSKEFAEVEDAATGLLRQFLAEARPNAGEQQAFDARFVLTVLVSVSEFITTRGVKDRQLRRWADECSAMLSKHLGL